MRNPLITIALLWTLGSGHALAFGNCLTPGYLERFDSRPSARPCEEIARDTIVGGLRGTVDIRLISYLEAPALAGFDARLAELADRVSVAMRQMGGLDLLDTTILVSTLEPAISAPGGGHAYGAATGWFADDECTVIFYKPPYAVAEDYFLVATAHAIFHCIEGRTWPERAAQYSVGGVWWVEGAADYFSHLVAPNTAQLDGRASLFDSRSPTTSLVDMAYESSIFFLWVGADAGEAAVRRLIEATPTTPGKDAQIAALQAALPVERFLAFGGAYLDGEIRQPGGRRAPTTAQFDRDTETFSAPRTFVGHTPDAYVLTRTRFVFREGRTYALTASGANGVASRFSESEGEWTEPPERVMACDEDKSYVVVTSSAEGAANQRFDVNDVEELDQRACCLVGAWKPTEEALFETARMQNQIAATIPVPDASVSCNYTGGDWSVSFTAGGDGALEWNEFANECVAALPRGQRTTSGVWNGALDFSWAILDERDPSRPELIGANATYTDNTATNTVTTKVGPMSTRPRIIPLSAPSDGNFAYQCSETELTLYGFYGLHPDARHLRAGGSR